MADFRGVHMQPIEFRQIRDLLYERTGVWYTEDRTIVLENRLYPRLAATGSHSFLDYYHLLAYGGAEEMQTAVDAMTNNETYFFRELAQLAASVALIARTLSVRGEARILSAGCASGEEPYTLTMLLHELGHLEGETNIEVVGVDVNASVLERARAARYGSSSFRSTEGRYLDWYFEMRGGQLELSPRLRQSTTFAHMSILDAARFARLGMFDVVLCRNVLIYFDDRARITALETLRSVLRPGGHLFLGHSESLYRITNEFELVTIEGAIGYRRPAVSAVPAVERGGVAW